MASTRGAARGSTSPTKFLKPHTSECSSNLCDCWDSVCGINLLHQFVPPDRPRMAIMSRYILATLFVFGIYGVSAFMTAMNSLPPVG
jgi:hypothetical protein